MNAAPLPMNLTREEYQQRAWIEADDRCWELAKVTRRDWHGAVSLDHAALQTELKLQEQNAK